MVGQTLGSYKLVSEIGKGGMGVVYLAEHTLLGRKAAVKLLRPDVANDQVERFFNEAKAVATLHHPGLVDVLDFGTSSDGRAFIVMEYLVGESLAERLDRDPRLPVPIACTIARHVANALAVAHDEGIIHRDLKPANVFLLPDPESPAGVRAKVLDFGIAKLVRDRGQKEVHTHSGAVIGTPRYMSPEQCKNARDVDARADIYSLGCILFEMLLGVAPYDYDNWAELVSAHLHEALPKPSELDPAIPKDVETLILKMLAKKAEQRHRSMNEVAQCLEVILREHANDWPVRLTPASGIRRPSTPANLDPTLLPSGEMPAVTQPATTPLPPEKPPTPVPTEPLKKRVPWLAISLAAGGALALAGAAVLVLANKSKPEPDDTAYIVVDERDRPIERHEVAPPPVPADAAVAVVPEIDAGVKATRPTTTDTAALTRTFGRQRDAVAACFREHPDDAQELSVRFSIDTNGKVVTAEVLPANVATTGLGTCVHAVAVATSFGPQPKAASFRVGPIARRQ
jgi:eukaryotic-like serine/threonine-protein kinase